MTDRRSTTNPCFIGRLSSALLLAALCPAAASASIVLDGATSPDDPQYITADTVLQIGDFAGAPGSMTITNGSVLDTRAGQLAHAGPGQVTVDGEGSAWYNSEHLVAGYSGNATLSIQNGGTVTNADASIAWHESSVSHASVSGSGSTWTTSAALSVGDEGDGTLNVVDGGTVESRWVLVGRSTTGHGKLNVVGEGSTVDIADDVQVAEHGLGVLTIAGGATVNAHRGFVAFHAGSEGHVDVHGVGSRWDVADELAIGDMGNANLAIREGAHVTAGHAVIGLFNQADGRVEMTGIHVDPQDPVPNTTWTVDDILVVGYEGQGSLHVANSAILHSAEAVIGYEPGSVGQVALQDAMTTWHNAGHLHVGLEGEARLEIHEGASVFSDSAAIGNFTDLHRIGTGHVVISGQLATWTSPEGITVGTSEGSEFGAFGQYTGILEVSDHARVDVTGSINSPGLTVWQDGLLTGHGGFIRGNVTNHGRIEPGDSPGVLTIEGNYHQSAEGSLALEIAGLTAGSAYDQLIVTGDATIAGTLTLRFLDGFAPTTGNVFDILQIGELRAIDQANVQIENLMTGFEYELNLNDGVLQLAALNDGVFVPEPASLALVGLAGLALLAGRRR